MNLNWSWNFGEEYEKRHSREFFSLQVGWEIPEGVEPEKHILNHWPPIIDSYVLHKLLKAGESVLAEKGINSDVVRGSFPRAELTEIDMKVIKYFCDYFVAKQAKQFKERLKKLRDVVSTFDGEVLNKLECDNGVFADNVILMVLAYYALDYRKTREEILEDESKEKENFCFFYGVIDELQKGCSHLIESFDIAGTQLVDHDYQDKSLQSFALTTKGLLDNMKKEVSDKLESGFESLDFEIDRFDDADWEVEYSKQKMLQTAKNPSGRIDAVERAVIYGMIHWMVDVFGFKKQFTCRKVAHMFLLFDGDSESPIEDQAIDSGERLRIKYLRYLRTQKRTLLQKGGFSWCNKASE